MYPVVIAILALVLTLSGPLYPLVRAPGLIAAAVAIATGLPAAVGLAVSGHVLRLLDRHPQQPSRGQAAFARGTTVLQFLLGTLHSAVLLCTDWLPLCARTPVVGTWPMIPGTLAVLPFLLSIGLTWAGLYRADRAVRQIALELYLFRGKPVRPVWALGQYLLHNFRHQVLFVLVPMLLILAASDLVVRYQKPIERVTGLPYAPDALIGLAALLVVLITPEILRYVWVTQRLPDGPLRDRLNALANRLRLRCRDILIWRCGGLVVNAAVMGVAPPLRYVLITDGMLEQMDDTKVEAVFGHEAGHVKRHHILYFLLFAFITGCLLTVFALRTQGLARRNLQLYQALALLFGLLLAAKWGLLFGWISRRFERQADVFGVQSLTLSGLPCGLPCPVHAPGGNPEPTRPVGALCTTAAHVFGDALHEVALLNGIRPEARSWRHSSISSRSRFLQELARHPQRVRRFERQVSLVKGVILAAALLAGLWAGWELRIWGSLAAWVG